MPSNSTKSNPRKLFAAELTLIIILASISTVAFALPLRLKKTTATEDQLQLYWNQDCSNSVAGIDWGALEPGASKNLTIYILDSTKQTLELHLKTQHWTATKDSNSIFLSWDQEGQVLEPNTVKAATLTISVANDTAGIKAFGFEIVIYGIVQSTSQNGNAKGRKF
jgi:hypothetical protein